MTDDRPVGVIGAGIAGLTAAAELASRGRRPIVFETAGRVGGCCATVDGPGGSTEPAASVVIGAEMLAAQLADIVDIRPHLVRSATAVRVVGPDFELDLAELDDLVDHLDRNSPGDVPRLLALADRCRRVSVELPNALWQWAVTPRRPARLLRLSRWGLAPYGRLVDHTFADASTRAVFRAFSRFYAGIAASRAPAAFAAVPLLGLTEGCFELCGGIQRLAELIADRVVATGGDIRLAEPVDRLETSHGRVRSVVTAGGETAVSGVVAACDVRTTLRLLRPAPPWSMRTRIRLQRPAVGCFSVIGTTTTPDRWPPMTWVLPRGGEPSRVGVGATRLWTYAAVTRGPVGNGRRRLRVGGAVDRSPPALDAVSERAVADRLLAMARRVGVGELHDVEIWTPATYEHRLGLPGGAAFGLEPSRLQMGPGRYGPRTPVENLVVAGQSTYPGFGIPYVALSGRLAVRILER
jgi:phytoene desaturase